MNILCSLKQLGYTIAPQVDAAWIGRNTADRPGERVGQPDGQQLGIDWSCGGGPAEQPIATIEVDIPLASVPLAAVNADRRDP